MLPALVKYLPVSANVPFVQHRFIALVISAFIIVGSIVAFAVNGINFGIDFRGGIQGEVIVPQPEADLDGIRSVAGGLGLGEPRVQGAGHTSEGFATVLVSLPLQPGEGMEGEQAQNAAREQLETALLAVYPDLDISWTVIGGAVSGELVVAGATAIAVALFLMLIYIWFRFEWQYSAGAIIALVHDVIATIGLFSITQLTFDLATVAAILTIVGYSMNDTVIVYDRIRENLRKYKKMPLEDVINLSINDTLSRTILTSSTTLVALVSLYVIGGASLQGFAFAMIWGIIIGTHSSIFVASPILMFTGVQREGEQA
ncbi:protein translocase subunit SecF [Maricaulis sp. CAU 1757]